MTKPNVEIYDLENVYDKQISPLMQQIISICKENKMPMLCSFAFENNENRGPGTCDTILNGFENRTIQEFNQALKTIRNQPELMAFTVMTGVSKND
ncbi:hypothetical protein KCI04_002478 [Salmonella enterica]|nr:hypothetical protein [Salmonella enterica]ECR4969894.1 hypothetical protein [Salmonella enterica]EEF8439347.1 hypothetical protein [Salmonella enterica]EFO8729816.1 hypothetical protein [Salmonella enterica]EHK1334339.1 hypothetical protein [Salmonella enterica]